MRLLGNRNHTGCDTGPTQDPLAAAATQTKKNTRNDGQKRNGSYAIWGWEYRNTTTKSKSKGVTQAARWRQRLCTPAQHCATIGARMLAEHSATQTEVNDLFYCLIHACTCHAAHSANPLMLNNYRANIEWACAPSSVCAIIIAWPCELIDRFACQVPTACRDLTAGGGGGGTDALSPRPRCCKHCCYCVGRGDMPARP